MRYAPLGTPLPATGKNPCPTSEVALYTIGHRPLPRRLVARLDAGRPVVGRGRFDIPVGDKWVKATMHFDRRTVAKFRREHFGSVVLNAIVRNGTVGTGADYSSEFQIDVR